MPDTVIPADLNEIKSNFDDLDSKDWALHINMGWVCISKPSAKFEDPDIKIIIKQGDDYRIIVGGVFIDKKLPAIQEDKLIDVLKLAEGYYEMLCPGYNDVGGRDDFVVYHRRYSFDVFSERVSAPEYETLYRSPVCSWGQGEDGTPCTSCAALYKDGESKVKPDDPVLTAEHLTQLINANTPPDLSRLVKGGQIILKNNNFNFNVMF